VILRLVLSICLACAAVSAAEHRGTVKAAGLPVPGAVVAARQGDRRITTSTDEGGVYHFAKLPAGEWKVEVEMMGFGTEVRDLKVAETAPDLEFTLRLQSAQAPKPSAEAPKPPSEPKPRPAETAKAAPRAPARPAQNGRLDPSAAQAAFQRLQVMQTAQNEVQAALNAPPPDAAPPDLSQNANESFLVSGSMSRGLQEVGRHDDGRPRRRR
jgi:hypothetical protein